MKKIILFFVLITGAGSVFCQNATTDVNLGINPAIVRGNNGYYNQNVAARNSSFQFNAPFDLRSGFQSFQSRGNLTTNPMAVFEMFANKFNLKVPTRFHYSLAKGVNFQAGLISNSRQPRLGAGVSLPHGFNFTAGYSANLTNLNRLGYSPMGKSPGIQFTAGYRLFGKR